MMDFAGFDPRAEVRIEGDMMTICFRFTDAAEALRAKDELIAAHARGEDVTITLSSPYGAGGLQ